MNEFHVEPLKPPMSIETRRKIGAAGLGRKLSKETIAKMRNASTHKKFPPKCNKCNSRDAEMCARYNMTCFTARENSCFKKFMKRKEHPDYVKKGVKHV